MDMNWFKRVKDWNAERYNLTYNPALEYRMLAEELKEYADGVAMLDEVEQIDALCDILFVCLGSLAKAGEHFNISVTEAMEYVLLANEAKPKERINGKIVKGNDWIDPKLKIQELFNARK